MNIDKPEYESPIEERLGIAMAKAYGEGVACQTQWSITTKGKQYRADFLLMAGSKSIVVEADGKDFHDYEDDRIRDLQMLDSGKVDAVFRFRGCDIFYAKEACAQYLTSYAPPLSQAGGEMLKVEDVWFASCCASSGHIRPILRTRVDIQDALDHRGILTSNALSCFGKTSDRKSVVLQMHAVDFDRKYRGPRILQIADYLALKGLSVEEWMGLEYHD